MMKKMLLTVCGLVVFLAAVAAQQPPAASADAKPSAPAQVIEQLRGAAPVSAAAPADETPSLRTILDRYDAMVRAGAQAAAGQREIQASAVPVPAAGAVDEVTAKKAVVVKPEGIAKPEGVPSYPLRSIIKELRTILAQLEALAEESR